MQDAPDQLGVLGKEIDGRYRLERFVGAGTMGAVYEGTQIAVGRRVAIKLLNATVQTNQEVRDRFRVEAQAIATLSHPNCVTLYDFGFADELGSLYMAVEFLDGRTLEELMQAGLGPRLAMLLARQIADVLVIAHEAGIMHRDLKPENVMIVEGPDGRPQAKVLDFGLARIFEDATGGTRLTRQGQLFGTPAYMSPEQCKSAMDVGPPADIYALGVSMFEMLMGRLPFESPSVPELLVLHSTQPAPPVATSDEIPLEVSELIARMMAKHPEDRPTAREVAAVLHAVLHGERPPALRPPSSASGEREVEVLKETLAIVQPHGDVTSTSMQVRPSRSRIVLPALIVAAVLLAATTMALVSLSGDDVESTTSAATARKPANTTKTDPAPKPPPRIDEPREQMRELAEDQAALVADGLTASASAVATRVEQPRRVAEADRARQQAARREERAANRDEAKKNKKPLRKLRSLGGKDLYE